MTDTVSNVDTIAFAAFGTKLGNADAAIVADVLAEFVELTASASSRTEFKHCRAAFIAAYMAARECTEKRAANRWAELKEAAGLSVPKSDNPDAVRKAAVRAAKKAADATNPDGAPVSPADGAEAAKGAKLELAAMEVHIIMLLRKGDYTKAAQCVADMASQAAPF